MDINEARLDSKDITHYAVEYDHELKILWGLFVDKKSASFTRPLMAEIIEHDRELAVDAQGVICAGSDRPVDFYVWASRMPGFFSLGGDLALFVDLIKKGNRAELMDYATQCIDIMFSRLSNYHSPRLVTVSLVQGAALGGGFEAALASDIIIAEEQAKFGLPEIGFNLFPGMGAYSILSRRIGPDLAKQMIVSGDIYSARACLERGVIDVVVPEGEGVNALAEYIKKTQKRKNGLTAFYNARRAVSPVTYQELMVVTTHWVEAALKLEDQDLRLMMKLVRSQQRKLEQIRTSV